MEHKQLVSSSVFTFAVKWLIGPRNADRRFFCSQWSFFIVLLGTFIEHESSKTKKFYSSSAYHHTVKKKKKKDSSLKLSCFLKILHFIWSAAINTVLFTVKWKIPIWFSVSEHFEYWKHYRLLVLSARVCLQYSKSELFCSSCDFQRNIWSEFLK